MKQRIKMRFKAYDYNLLDQTVREIVSQTRLAPRSLVLEVTESALMSDDATTLASLTALRDCGVQFSLDDFGTGFSSLSYLRRMPLDNVKIDRSFIKNLPADKGDLAIVRAILSIADSLGFSVTAEGVETHEQARTLTQMRCNLLQGYHVGRPVAAGDIPAEIARIGTAALAAASAPQAELEHQR